MIIVSQDKDEIINFDNIISIVIDDVWDDKPGQVLKAIDVRENRHSLGYYRNEKRAKEVLQEIMKKYLDIKCFYNSKYEVMQAIEQPKVFEMPKE